MKSQYPLYTGLPGVSFVPEDLPIPLQSIHAFASEWCLLNEEDIEEKAQLFSRQKLQDFLDCFFTNQSQIEAFTTDAMVNAERTGTAIPDPAVIVDLAFTAYDRLFTHSLTFRPSDLPGPPC